MCGIIGLVNSNNETLFKSLSFLQHRGQDSYGYSDGEKIEKYTGLVELPPENLKSGLVLGHTRYRTFGKVGIHESQPFLNDEMVLVHNGNIEIQGEISDSLYILKKIDKSNIFASIKNLILTEKGSFFCILIHKQKMYVFKDSMGIRPGVFGTRDKEIIISSENYFFDHLGFKMVDDIKPGEIMTIENGCIQRHYFGSCFKPCIFEYIYFLNYNSTIYGKSVSEFRVNMAERVAKKINFKVDYVCCIPSSSRIYALEIARCLNKPYFEPRIQKKRSFILPTQEERENYVKSKYKFDKDQIRSNVLFVDDSIVRGTTMKRIMKTFRDEGCVNLYVVSCAPKVINRNQFGINITTKEELVSFNRTHEEIEKYLNCDKLIYSDIQDLYDISGFNNLEMSIFE